MAKLIVQNPFTSVKEIALTHRIVLPKPRDWRLMPQSYVGEVNAIHQLRGVAVATNGIHVAILAESGMLHIGHLNWFVADEEPKQPRNATKVAKMPRQNIFEGISFE